MSKMLLPLLTVIGIGLAASAQETELDKSAFDSMIAKHCYRMQLQGNEMVGEGVTWLLEQAKQSHYFLIGERHGTAEIPLICGALYSKLSEEGYDYVALEIGKIASLRVQEIIRSGEKDGLFHFLQKEENRDAIAFLDWREEADLVNHIAKYSAKGPRAIWGLDHEFIYGFGMYLTMLESQATTPAQAMAIESLQGELKENRFLLGADNLERLTILKTLFKNNSRTDNIIDALLDANYVYGRFRGEITRVESNAYRENLMKRNLYQNLIHNNNPKVFIKLGGFHAAPSISDGKITLGTFVEEWANVNNLKAFNLYCDVNGGTIRSSGQDGSDGAAGIKPALSLFGSIPDNTHLFSRFLKGQKDPILIDLRPLRDHIDQWAFLSRGQKSLINSFDAYMAVPNVTPATLVSQSRKLP